MGGFEPGTLVLKATAVPQQMLYTLYSNFLPGLVQLLGAEPVRRHVGHRRQQESLHLRILHNDADNNNDNNNCSCSTL